MIALCAILVRLGYFAEVNLSFFLVGHTHEDIDQRFSVISESCWSSLTREHLVFKHLQPQGTWSMCGIGRKDVSTLRLINFGKTVLYFCVLKLQNCTFCTWI